MKKIKVIYATDPICSYCWEIEPILRKFQLEYKDVIDFKTIMGGLLPDIETFKNNMDASFNVLELEKHWIEAGKHYGMPIVGTIWSTDPIQSSYPPSLVFKQLQKLSDTSSLKFLRVIREELFAFNRNISKDKVLEDILNRIDRNGKKIVSDSKTLEAKELLEEDLALNLKLKVTGFPTVIMKNEDGLTETLVGFRPYEDYKNALERLSYGKAPSPRKIELKELFSFSKNLFEKEIMEIYNLEKEEVIPFLNKELGEDIYEVRKVMDTFFVILNPLYKDKVLGK